jgi:hypothetical protein
MKVYAQEVRIAVPFSCLKYPKEQMLLQIMISRPSRIFCVGKSGGSSARCNSNQQPITLILWLLLLSVYIYTALAVRADSIRRKRKKTKKFAQ